MGLLIFLARGGNQLNEFLHLINTNDQPIAELETAVFGFDRCEAAAYILSLWKIPPRIIESILLQRTPNESDYMGVNALTAVHIAASLLKLEIPAEYNRLFEQNLDLDYVKRINKLEQLSLWEQLAEKVQAQAKSNL